MQEIREEETEEETNPKIENLTPFSNSFPSSFDKVIST